MVDKNVNNDVDNVDVDNESKIKVEYSHRNNVEIFLDYSYGEDEEKKELSISYYMSNPDFYFMLKNSDEMNRCKGNQEKHTKALIALLDNLENLIGREVFRDLNNFYKEAGENLELDSFMGQILEALESIEDEKAKKS